MKRITKASSNAIELIRHFEGLKLTAYLCSAGVWTIGIGTTRYPGGAKVKRGDRLDSAEAAIRLFQATLKTYEKAVDDHTRDDVTQNEFDALVCLCYNIGEPQLKTSSVLRLVNAYSKDKEAIHKKFLLWKYETVDGRLKVSAGLIRRRKAEAHLFNYNEVKFFQ